MKQSIEEVAPTIRRVLVEVSANTVNSFLDDAAQDFGKDMVLDGFRAGKIPPEVVEARYSTDEVCSLARQNMLDSVMASLIHESALYPVNRAEYDEFTPVRGQGCSFTVHVEVIPPLPLPDRLEELTVRVGAPVMEQQVFFAALQRLRQARGNVQDVTDARCPEDGDVVVLDVQAACAGRPVPGLCAQNLRVRLGGDEPHPVLGQAARSLKVGEEGSCTMPCPEKYPDATLHGKQIQLTVYLRAIQKEMLPELDDAFAAQLGKGDLRTLQEEVYKDLLNQIIVRHQHEAENTLLNSLLDPLDFALPPSLVTIHRQAYTLQARAYLEKQGIAGEELGKRLEQLAQEGENIARSQARAQAFLMALAYREKLSVSAGELEQEIQSMAQRMQCAVEDLNAELYKSHAVYELQDQLLAEKALRHLYTKAQKIVVDKDGNPVPAKAGA